MKFFVESQSDNGIVLQNTKTLRMELEALICELGVDSIEWVSDCCEFFCRRAGGGGGNGLEGLRFEAVREIEVCVRHGNESPMILISAVLNNDSPEFKGSKYQKVANVEQMALMPSLALLSVKLWDEEHAWKIAREVYQHINS